MVGQWYAPAALPPAKTRYPLYRSLGGPQGRSGLVRKISPAPGFDPRIDQPVASRCTDWAIAAPLLLTIPVINASKKRSFWSFRGWLHSIKSCVCVCVGGGGGLTTASIQKLKNYLTWPRCEKILWSCRLKHSCPKFSAHFSPPWISAHIKTPCRRDSYCNYKIDWIPVSVLRNTLSSDVIFIGEIALPFGTENVSPGPY